MKSKYGFDDNEADKKAKSKSIVRSELCKLVVARINPILTDIMSDYFSSLNFQQHLNFPGSAQDIVIEQGPFLNSNDDVDYISWAWYISCKNSSTVNFGDNTEFKQSLIVSVHLLISKDKEPLIAVGNISERLVRSDILEIPFGSAKTVFENELLLPNREKLEEVITNETGIRLIEFKKLVAYF